MPDKTSQHRGTGVLATSQPCIHTGAMEKIYIGIDGGGTRTRLGIMTRDRTILHQSHAKSSNIYAVGEAQAKENVKVLLDQSLSLFTGRAIGGLCFGSAGLGREEERQTWQSFFDGYFENTVQAVLVSDALLQLAGNLPQPSGVCVISGTGSICIGRNGEGTVVRSGGFGSVLGDEGSGWWIAKEAIRRSLASAEGRDLPTGLGAAIQTWLGLTRLEEVIGWANAKERTKDQVASFAPQVSHAALEGDDVAIHIMDEAIEHLVALVEATARRLPPTWPHHLGLSGGVLERDQYIVPRIIQRLSPRWMLFHTDDAAVKGAMVMAVEGGHSRVAENSSSR